MTAAIDLDSALDEEHAAPGSECYGCHQTLDPMREFVRASYTSFYGQQLDPARVIALGIPMNRVLDAVRDANLDRPAGKIEEGRYEVTLRAPMPGLIVSILCVEGDTVEVEIPGVGVLQNPVRAADG